MVNRRAAVCVLLAASTQAGARAAQPERPTATESTCSGACSPREFNLMILALTKLLLSREATVEQIARRIGGTLERRRTGYWLHPAGPGLSEVWIGIEPAPTGEMLRYVRLRLAPPGVGGLEAFNQAFGPYARMPAEPEGEAFSVRYRCDDASLPYLGRIFVALSAEPSEPLARVTQVTIRREERL